MSEIQTKTTFLTERHPTAEILAQGAETFQQRNAIYGDSYNRFGGVMRALFPDGLRCDDAESFIRLGIVVQIINKLTRYTGTMASGGHQDSAHDMMVYAAMLASVTEEDAHAD